MNSPVRHTQHIFTSVTAGICCLSAVILFILLRPYSEKVLGDTSSLPPKKHVYPDFSSIATHIQSLPASSAKGELARRFRLAGTILGVSNIGADEPLAVIDDRQTVSQKIVRRNTQVTPGVTLIHVRTDSIVLSGPSGEEELFLEKGLHLARQAQQSNDPVDESVSEHDSKKRFGKGLVFPGRWNFSRDMLLDYYSELRDEPQRLLAIFDSMDPVYEIDPEGDQTITGYVVDVKGEADFFEAAGLKNGDVVRAVNSVTMTNRRRAEAFIKSFVENDAGTFVLDIERNGTQDKHVYVIE